MTFLDKFRRTRVLVPQRTLTPLEPAQVSSAPDSLKVRVDSQGRTHLRNDGIFNQPPDPHFAYRDPDVVTAEAARTQLQLGWQEASPDLLRYQQIFELGLLQKRSIGHNDIGNTIRTYEFERGSLIEHALFSDSRGAIREVHLPRAGEKPLVLKGHWLETVEGLGLGRFTGLEETRHPTSGRTTFTARFERGEAYLEAPLQGRAPELRELVLGQGAEKILLSTDDGLAAAASAAARSRNLGAFRAANLRDDPRLFQFESGDVALSRNKHSHWVRVDDSRPLWE